MLAGVSSGVRPRRLLVVEGTSRLSPGLVVPSPDADALLEVLAAGTPGSDVAAGAAFFAADFFATFFFAVAVVTSTAGSFIASEAGAGCGASWATATLESAVINPTAALRAPSPKVRCEISFVANALRKYTTDPRYTY